jgi:hypothetical protein
MVHRTKQRTTKHTLFGRGKNILPEKHKRTIGNVHNGVNVTDYSLKGACKWVAKHKTNIVLGVSTAALAALAVIRFGDKVPIIIGTIKGNTKLLRIAKNGSVTLQYRDTVLDCTLFSTHGTDIREFKKSSDDTIFTLHVNRTSGAMVTSSDDLNTLFNIST